MPWRPMAEADLGAVHALAEEIHLDHPERLAVNHSRAIWEKRGFIGTDLGDPAGRLQSYGADAVFMVLKR